MKTQIIRLKRSWRGMTLIEMIGVLTVLAVLAAFLVPAFIRKMDQMAGDKESAALKLLADALQSSVLRNRYVPMHTNWAQTIAVERGVNLTDVTMNLRRQPRVFLIDPALQIGARIAGQDYQQDSTGSVIIRNGGVIAPISPRMIVLSSIGEPLPAGVVTGVPLTNEFNAIWNAGERTLPAGSPWTGWRGADDLKIQRINLSPLFVHLVLTSYDSPDGDGQFRMDNAALLTAPDPSVDPVDPPGHDAYYIQNSVLSLHFDSSRTNALDTKQILTRDISYVYQQHVWRTSIQGLGLAGGMDIGDIVERFLRAPHNPNALYTTNGQVVVVEKFLDFMQAYQDWETAGFPDYSSSQWQLADQKQGEMIFAVQKLYKDPTYSPTEVPCPP